MEDKKNSARFWAGRIKSVKDNKHYRSWKKKAESIVNRYCGIPFNADKMARVAEIQGNEDPGDGYNALFRNIKVRMPYLLPYIPSVVVEREHKDEDDPAKYAAMILERIANSAVKKQNLNRILNSVKLYAELYGIATPWLRYDQKIGTRLVEAIDEETGMTVQAEEEYVESECIEVDLVNPMDLVFDAVKKPEDIKWVGRRVPMTREDFKKKFGDIDSEYSFGPAQQDGDDKPSRADNDGEKRVAQDTDVCDIYEIWDKPSRKIYYYCPTSSANDDLLGVEDYPCDIDFPCVIPLMYDEYPDTIYTPSRHSQFLTQYRQIDSLTESINKLLPTLWVNGFYAKDLVGIDKAFSKTNQNAMVGIKVPNELLSKMPGAKLEDFVVTFDRAAQISMLNTLYDQREKIIGDVHRGIGVIGLMEGQTNVQEGVQTNKIKGTFGTLWIQEDQKRVAEWLVRFFTLYLSYAAQMFEPQTLIEESLIYETEDWKEYQEQVAQAQQAAMQGQAVEIPEDPFETAIAFIKDNPQRKIRLDIATEDTRSYVDAEYKNELDAFQTSMMNNLQTFGNIVEGNPEFAPAFKELFMQTVRAHRVGKQFEDSIEKAISFAIESIQRKAAQPPQEPQPDPTVVAATQIEAQARVQAAQISAQSRENIEAAKIQAGIAKDGNKVITDAQIKAGELQVKRDALEEKAANDAAKINIEQQKVDLKQEELEVETALSIAKGMATGNYDADLTIS